MESGGESKDDEELIGTANTLLVQIGRKPHIKRVEECDHHFFIDIYEGMLGEALIPRSSSKNDTIDVMTRNIQAIINSLSEDVLGVDISHVSASSIVNKDREHIQCLLEIFDGLLQYVLEGIKHEDQIEDYGCDSSDSDILDENHSILSDVMEEEFGRPREAITVPLSPEGVTWRSGDVSHTVTWSDRSPGGESTATDDLLLMAQKSGNSTDELIREAQDIQRDVDLSRSVSHLEGESLEVDRPGIVLSPPLNHRLKYVSGRPKADQNRDVNLPQPIQKVIVREKSPLPPESVPLANQCHVLRVPLSNSGSRCPSSASSTDLKLFDLTVDSLKATESYTIPTKEMEDESCTIPSLKESTSAKDISDLSISNLLVKPDDKKTAGSSGPKASAIITHSSLDSGRGESERDARKRKVHHSRKQRDRNSKRHDSGSGDTTVEDGKMAIEAKKILKKKKEKHTNEPPKEKIQESTVAPTQAKTTSKPEVKDAGPLSVDHSDNATRLAKQKPIAVESKSSRAVKPVTSAPVVDSRSKQLSDLSARLLKLQNEVRPHMSLSRQSNITASSKEHSNVAESTTLEPRPVEGKDQAEQSVQLKEDTESVPCKKPMKEKKDKAKVSFQLDSRHEYEYPASDTEIDYSTFRDSGRDSDIEEPLDSLEDSQRDTAIDSSAPPVVVEINKKQRKKQTEQDSSVLTGKDVTTTTLNETTLDATPPLEKRYLKRDERLQKLHKRIKVEEKENRKSVQKLSENYSKHHGKLVNQKKLVRKQSNLQLKTQKQKEKDVKKFKSSPSPLRGRNTGLKSTANNKYTAKLSAIYGKGSPSKKPASEKKSDSPGKKRAASTSPVARRRLTKAPLVLEDNEILPLMEEEFPFIHLSPHTAKLMWQKQLRQVTTLKKYGQPHKSLKTRRTIEDAVKKQEALASMMKKEIEHNRRIKDLKERKDQDTVVKRNLQERRQRSARARRYYSEFAVLNKARMLKKRTKEEKIFKQLFEDGLDIQKQRINEMRKYAREKKEMNEKKQRDEIASLENFYKDKFACLAESVAQEKYEIEVRRKAQGQVLNKMRSTMRKRMEKDLREIQDELNNEDDPCFFRQLDADVLKKEFQLATYKASKLR